jgi:hypothetical protein
MPFEHDIGVSDPEFNSEFVIRLQAEVDRLAQKFSFALGARQLEVAEAFHKKYLAHKEILDLAKDSISVEQEN